MSMAQLLLVLCVILGVLVVLVIPTLLFLRQHAMKGDVSVLFDKVDTAMREYVKFCEGAASIIQKVSVVEAELHAAKTRDASTQETIRNLGNKLNSRARAERKAEPVAPDGEEETEGPTIEQLSMQFPGQVLPMNQPKPEQGSPAVRERRFGELP